MRRSAAATLVGLLVIASLAATPVAAAGNEPPMADAGLDQEVPLNATVVLDATGSYDPDGTVRGYDWTITTPEGRTVAPTPADGARPTFVPNRSGRYEVTVTVTDDDGATASDTLYLEVVPRGAYEPGDSPSTPPGGGSGGGSDDGGSGAGGGSDGGSDGSGSGPGGDRGGPGGPDEGGSGGASGSGGSDGGSDIDSGSGSDSGSDDGSGDGPGGEAGDGPGGNGTDSDDDGPGSGGVDAANAQPWVTIDGPGALSPGEAGTYTVSAGDAESEASVVAWGGGETTGSVTRTAPDGGTMLVTVTVSDTEGARTTVTRTVRVLESPNEPPSVEIDPPGTVPLGANVTFEARTSDPDGSVAEVTWEPNRTIEFATRDPVTVRVEVTDDDGATASDTLRIAALPDDRRAATAVAGVVPEAWLPVGVEAWPRSGDAVADRDGDQASMSSGASSRRSSERSSFTERMYRMLR